MKIVINGCGIAGPALAYWLLKAGHEPVIVEEATKLRCGGYIIDFWGIGFDIAEKMGLIDRVRQLGYQVKEVRFVDSRGRRVGGFSADVLQRLTAGRFTSLRRSDLSAEIYAAIQDRVETIFNDSVANIEERSRGIRVSFDRSPSRDVDLVVGADGLHSRVRRLVFGTEEKFERRLGYCVAFEAPGYRPRDELVYTSHSRPCRQVSRFSMRDDTTLFLFVFCQQLVEHSFPATDEERRDVLRQVFGRDGWECPAILASMEDVQGIYFDRVSQIRMERWTRGRSALVGDAAACVSLLAGEGTGLALAEAYVLAGELSHAGADYAAAFDRYERTMMPLLRRKQKAAERFASSFAPKTTFGIGVRNLATRLLQFPLLAELLIGRSLRDNIQLPEYSWR